MTRKFIVLLAAIMTLVALFGCRSAHVTSAILYIDQATLPMYEKAIAVLHEGLEFSPNEAEAYFYLGEAHSHVAEVAINKNDFQTAKKNYEISYDYYQTAQQMDSKLADRVLESLLFNYTIQINNATNEYQIGYNEAAEGYFRLAYAAYPDSTGPIKNIARMKIRMAIDAGNDTILLNEALVLLDQVLTENPSAYELLSDKANVLGRLNRPDEATAIYDNLLAEHPDDAGLLIDIANLSSKEMQFERAADLYVRIINIFENDDDSTNDQDVYTISLRTARSYALDEVKRYEDALFYFDKALRLEEIPQQMTMLNKLQTHYEYGKQFRDKAKEEMDPELKAALELQAKEQFTAGVNVGNSLVGQYFEAQNGYFYLAQCQNALGDFDGATRNMGMYEQLSVSNP